LKRGKRREINHQAHSEHTIHNTRVSVCLTWPYAARSKICMVMNAMLVVNKNELGLAYLPINLVYSCCLARESISHHAVLAQESGCEA
jgi:hypothetical protein